jgi:GNAT superfamily N-acetyltransferase
MTATKTDEGRIRAHERAFFEAGADRVVELPYARARFRDDLPRHLDLNAVCVTGAAPGDLLERLDEVQAGRPVRHAELPGDVPAPRGWQQDRLVHLRFAAPAPVPSPDVVEVGRAALTGLRREWLVGEIPHVADVLLAGDEVLFAATPARGFAVLDDDGTPVAMTLLVGGGDGDVAMVEDVYTTSAHRGHGHAAALVATAVAAALAGGADLVHVPTAADGRARVLYERLGFEAVATTTRLTRFVETDERR